MVIFKFRWYDRHDPSVFEVLLVQMEEAIARGSLKHQLCLAGSSHGRTQTHGFPKTWISLPGYLVV